jgi:hypothetical protein
MADPNYSFVKGNVLRSYFQVKSQGGFISPSVVTCKFQRDGDGSPTSATVAQDGVGCYHADIDTSSLTAGDFSLSWQGTGAAVCKREKRFTLTEALIP